MCIAYDPSREAFLQPGLRPTLFRTGDAEPLSIDAICAVLVRDLADHAPINYERVLFPPCEAG